MDDNSDKHARLTQSLRNIGCRNEIFVETEPQLSTLSEPNSIVARNSLDARQRQY